MRRIPEERDLDGQFRLREVNFGGDGLSPEFAECGWQSMRDAIYEARAA
jgi:hypothetical protein